MLKWLQNKSGEIRIFMVREDTLTIETDESKLDYNSNVTSHVAHPLGVGEVKGQTMP